MVWTSDIFNSRDLRTEQTGMVWGRDLHTGEVKVEFMPDVETHWFHHRCYRAKATEDYLLTSRTGIEFVDIRSVLRRNGDCADALDQALERVLVEAMNLKPEKMAGHNGFTMMSVGG